MIKHKARKIKRLRFDLNQSNFGGGLNDNDIR